MEEPTREMEKETGAETDLPETEPAAEQEEAKKAAEAKAAKAAKEAEAAAIAQAAPAQAEKTEQLRLYPVAGRPTPRWNAQPNSVYISPASSILLWSYSWIILLLTEKISGERSMALIISPI